MTAFPLPTLLHTGKLSYKLTTLSIPTPIPMRRISTILLACLFTSVARAQSKPATPPAKENFHLYLLMGQSNMAGRDRTGMDAQQENPRILSLNPEAQWIVAKDPLDDGVDEEERPLRPGRYEE